MRGAISVGDVVIDRGRSIFVGPPIADAYQSEKSIPHRGVGIHVTETTTRMLLERVKHEPFPPCLVGVCPSPPRRSAFSVWYEGFLFANPWSGRYRIYGGPMPPKSLADLSARPGITADFDRRGLPRDEKATKILEQSVTFYEHCQQAPCIEAEQPTTHESLPQELERLSELGLNDGRDDTQGS